MVTEDVIDLSEGCWKNFCLPTLENPEYITVHNTAEPFSAYQERLRVQFRSDNLHTSFHFAVDEDVALQILPLDKVSYHAGDGVVGLGNAKSISVEICRSACYGENETLYRRSEERAIELCANLMCQYGIPLKNVRCHNAWSGKFCPHRILAERRWRSFTERIALYHEDLRYDEGRSLKLREEPIVVQGCRGNLSWRDFRGNVFNDVDVLIGYLHQEFRSRVLVSAWHDPVLAKENLSLLRDSGVDVVGYYVPVCKRFSWLRRNVLQPLEDFAAYCKHMLIAETISESAMP